MDDEEMSNEETKKMKIPKIREGTVIDHIPPELCFKIINLLNLENIGSIISAATNLDSKKMGKKALIKIGGKFLSHLEVDKISVVAPDATLSIIKDYNVEKKIKLKIPEEINKIIKCNNTNCITNIEPVATRFKVVEKTPLRIMCYYCERILEKEDLNLC